LTTELYFADAETNTRHKKAEIATQTGKDADAQDDEYDSEEEAKPSKQAADVDFDRLASWLD